MATFARGAAVGRRSAGMPPLPAAVMAYRSPGLSHTPETTGRRCTRAPSEWQAAAGVLGHLPMSFLGLLEAGPGCFGLDLRSVMDAANPGAAVLSPGCRGPQDPVLKGDDGEQPSHEVQGGQTAGGRGTTLPSFLTRASVFIRWPLAAPA